MYSRDQTHFLRAIGQGLYPLSHLAGPVTFIFNIYAISQVILVQVGLLHLGKNIVLNLQSPILSLGLEDAKFNSPDWSGEMNGQSMLIGVMLMFLVD